MYPAGEAGIAVRRVAFREGVTLRVLEAGPANAPLTAVLLHGWAGSVYSFAETTPALASAGYRVVAIDLPGHGLSDKPWDPSYYTLPAMADAVSSAIAGVGVRRHVIVTHSMAGTFALELARRGGADLCGLVLSSSVGVGRATLAPLARLLTPDVAAGVLSRLVTRGLVRFVLGHAFTTAGRPTEHDVDQYWAPSQFAGFVPALLHCLHQMNWNTNADALRGLTLPAMVIAGGRDRVVHGAARAGELIAGARVLIVPDGGHLVMQECAATVNPEIVAFLHALRR
ncbi:MAG TPA: alpha/beta fold hydrolase [Gemmatimonadaceae bacterium]